MRKLLLSAAFSGLAVAVLAAGQASSTAFYPIEDVRPGMIGVGRTVFADDNLEEFRAHVVGVLRNALGPRRDLILARLEGGPLANTGVIQGMSGSPVYLDGKLLGAVSYALGSFPKEPLAGITPIGEMTSAVESSAPRPIDTALSFNWPAEPTQVFAALSRIATRASAPVSERLGNLSVVGPASLAALTPALRPIGAAMVMSGFEPSVDRDLRGALAPVGLGPQSVAASVAPPQADLKAGDAVGMSLVRGDLELGATGTVTHVDGARVYAFGHPFLNLGPTSFAMTKAHVFTVLPSLDSSLKIASLGPVIGTITQDRATAVGGTLGAGPSEVGVHVALMSERAPTREFNFSVLHDPQLTALFTYVSVLNSLAAYERESGVLSVAVKGTISFGGTDKVVIDDVFSGDGASLGAAGAITTPVGTAISNSFTRVMPQSIELELHTSEREEATTIERVWLDTTRPRLGATHQLQVQLQDYRGDKRVISLPITMPTQASGPLTLFVGSGAALTELEGKDLNPGRAANWSDVLASLNRTRRNNRVYVRLISSAPGTVVAGGTLPGLPGSVRSVLDTDPAADRAPLAKTVVGEWEERLDRSVRGAREVSITLTARP